MASASGTTNADPKGATLEAEIEKPSHHSNLRHCAYCLKEFAGSLTCGQCHRRAYCSKDCQRKDWSPSGDGQGHKVRNEPWWL